jgi:hypothetical protein
MATTPFESHDRGQPAHSKICSSKPPIVSAVIKKWGCQIGASALAALVMPVGETEFGDLFANGTLSTQTKCPAFHDTENFIEPARRASIIS